MSCLQNGQEPWIFSHSSTQSVHEKRVTVGNFKKQKKHTQEAKTMINTCMK
jgi:hypothetical protein